MNTNHAGISAGMAEEGISAGMAEEALALPIFSGISKDHLGPMLKCLQATERKYKKNEFIFLEGENVAYIGVILSGQVNMLKEDFGGQLSVLAVMRNSELFGETFVCGSRQDTTVSFQAAAPTRALLCVRQPPGYHCFLPGGCPDQSSAPSLSPGTERVL